VPRYETAPPLFSCEVKKSNPIAQSCHAVTSRRRLCEGESLSNVSENTSRGNRMPTGRAAIDEKRRAIRSVTLGTLLRLLRWPFALLSLTVIPRTMQSETYGRFAFFMSVYLLANLMTDIGVLQVFGRFVPGPASQETCRRRTVLLHGFLAIGMVATSAICLATIVLVRLFPARFFPENWLLPFCLLLFATLFEGVLFAFLYGLNCIARYSAREALRSFLLFICVWISFLLFGLHGAIWSLVVKEGILALIALYWTRHYLFQPVRLSWPEMRPYLRFGLSFFIPMLLFGFLQRSGALFVQKITHMPEQVGYFDVANQFFLMSVGFFGTILITLIPSMSACREAGDENTIHRWHGNIMTYCGIAVALAFQTLAWFGEQALAMFLGPEFLPVRNMAMVMTLAMAPGLIAYVGMNYAILDKDPLTCARGVLASLVAMTLACLALVPAWQANGATWAAVTGYSVLAAFFWSRYRARLRIALKGFVQALALGAAFSPTALISAHLPWPALGFIVSIALYLALTIALRIANPAPLRLIALKTLASFGIRMRN
jgi:O-antigen/teichoic acid export membrane protein